MTQEEKELVLQNLCARLPYDVKVLYNNKVFSIDYVSCTYEEVKLYNNYDYYILNISVVKPYLFPLSSMTEEQEREYNDLNYYELDFFQRTDGALDYLIKNHFDYRNLIEEGLAIDCTNLNIY